MSGPAVVDDGLWCWRVGGGCWQAGGLAGGAGGGGAPGLLLFGDAGGVEGGDVAEGAGCALDEGQGEQGAGALAEAQAQVDQRSQPEVGKGDRVAGLDAAVAGEAGRGHVGGQGGGGQRGGAR